MLFYTIVIFIITYLDFALIVCLLGVGWSGWSGVLPVWLLCYARFGLPLIVSLRYV